MARYFVVGGTYADTQFEHPAPGSREERVGPFEDYEVARKEWAKRTWATVDDATTRWRIDQEDDGEFDVSYYVVGGIYTDTTFTKLADVRQEQRDGPYFSIEEARKAWQSRAFSTIDDALARYRIETHRGKSRYIDE